MGVDPFPDMRMWLLVPLFLQAAGAQVPVPPATYELLRAEHVRGADMRALDAALSSGDSVRQRLAELSDWRF